MSKKVIDGIVNNWRSSLQLSFAIEGRPLPNSQAIPHRPFVPAKDGPMLPRYPAIRRKRLVSNDSMHAPSLSVAPTMSYDYLDGNACCAISHTKGEK